MKVNTEVALALIALATTVVEAAKEVILAIIDEKKTLAVQ